mgnify:FL=1
MLIKRIKEALFGPSNMDVFADRVATTLGKLADSKKEHYDGIAMRLQYIERDAQTDIANMEQQIMHMRDVMKKMVQNAGTEKPCTVEEIMYLLEQAPKGVSEKRDARKDHQKYIDTTYATREGDTIKYV